MGALGSGSPRGPPANCARELSSEKTVEAGETGPD